MNLQMIAAAAFLAVLPGLAAAQGFAGAEVAAEILRYTEDAEQGETKYSGGLEFDLWANIGVAGNLAYRGAQVTDFDGRNFTLHGLYDFGPETAAGLFYARESLEVQDADVYGIEATTMFRGFDIEATAARVDYEVGDSASILSAAASYDLGRFDITGFAGVLRDDLTTSRVAVGGEYQLGLGPTLFAEVGRISQEDVPGGIDPPEAYLSIGARVAIGPNGGTTFGNRGVLEIVPSF